MWQRSLHDAWHHGKRTVGNMWNHAVKWAGQIDQAMSVSKRMFAALHPAIEDLGGGDINRVMMHGFKQYDQGRHDIVGLHNNVEATLSRLRRAAPEMDL